MKFILAAVLCALAVKTVRLMPVAEPGVLSAELKVVPLEKDASVLHTDHLLRRATPENAAPATVSEHQEGETPEEHAKHAHLLAARLDDKVEKPEIMKQQVEESKPLVDEVKVAETGAELLEKKDEDLLKGAGSETVLAAKAIAAEIITPAETLAPIPAEVAAPASVETKNETPVAQGKNAPSKEIASELKEEVKSEEQSTKPVEKIEEPQPIAKLSPITSEPAASAAVESIAPATVAAAEELKGEKKIEPVVAEADQKASHEAKEDVKKVEDKTDRVTRGTEEEAPAAVEPAPVAATPVAEVAAAIAEPQKKLIVEKKEEKIELPEKKFEAAEAIEAVKAEKKPELAKAAEQHLIVEASEAAATDAVAEQPKEAEKKDELSEVKAEEHIIQAKSAPLETQPETQPSEAAVAPTEIKSEPVVDTIKAKSEPIETSKESSEAVKAEDSSSSEEKSSEEDKSGEKLEKSVGIKSADLKKNESKAEELPKPQEVKELEKQE